MPRRGRENGGKGKIGIYITAGGTLIDTISKIKVNSYLSTSKPKLASSIFSHSMFFEEDKTPFSYATLANITSAFRLSKTEVKDCKINF